MFVDLDYYFDTYNGNVLSNDDNGKKALKQSIRQINRITNGSIDNNYIVGRGEPLLTNVYDIICEHAEYIFENNDKIDDGTAGLSISSRNINGVSVSYSNTSSSSSIISTEGVYIKKDLYDELVFLGLCYRGLCR